MTQNEPRDMHKADTIRHRLLLCNSRLYHFLGLEIALEQIYNVFFIVSVAFLLSCDKKNAMSLFWYIFKLGEIYFNYLKDRISFHLRYLYELSDLSKIFLIYPKNTLHPLFFVCLVFSIFSLCVCATFVVLC